jgi:hypothetical protein
VVWVQLLPLLLRPPCAPDPAATVVTVAPDSAAPDPAAASDPTPLLPPTRAGLAVARACSAYGGAAAVAAAAAAAAGACAAAAAARAGPLSTARTRSRSHQSRRSCWPVRARSRSYRSIRPGPIVRPRSCWPHDVVVVVAWLCTLRIPPLLQTPAPNTPAPNHAPGPQLRITRLTTTTTMLSSSSSCWCCCSCSCRSAAAAPTTAVAAGAGAGAVAAARTCALPLVGPLVRVRLPRARRLFCLWYSACKSMISILKVYFVLTFVFEVKDTCKTK